ncbi:PorP/SprF family type IX secretion system membrane protein [Fibrella aquatica]|jgi:type IX secretion system PorP/SprF family membrane protein|uniref:PorP/SprF family type IX secretion system membrane protein n=1 Tax=Fibrella aquatica TaxID=3242487 RepID=UPI003520AC20
MRYSICFLLFACLSIGCLPALAQKEVLYSQYLVNPMAINPAFAGVREDFNMTLGFRGRLFSFLSQNAQQIATPITQTFAADGQLGSSQFGLGFQILNDRNSTLGNLGLSTNLSYRVDLPNLSRLFIGVQGGVNVLPVVGTGINRSGSSALLSYGVGLYYDADKFFAGVSVPELNSKAFGFGGFSYRQPVYVQGGAKLDLTDDFKLIPSIVLSRSGAEPMAVDLNARVWYANRAAVGVSVRQNNTFTNGTFSYVQGTLEYQLSGNVRLGYLFNSIAPEAPLTAFQRTMHELVFRYTPNPNTLKFSYF